MMKSAALLFVPLFAVGAALASNHDHDMSMTGGMMTGGMMTGGMMTGGMTPGGMVTDMEIGGAGTDGMPVEAPVEALAQTGGMMTGGMMTGGMTDQRVEVTLSGDQQVPPVATDATGSASVTLMGDAMTVSGDFSGLSSPVVEIAGTPAHIHMAPMGENGDVVFPLNVSAAEDGTSGIFSLSTTLSPEQIDAFNAGELYINIHTEMHQGGELRGQITPGM
jgi:hypothetical protein